MEYLVQEDLHLGQGHLLRIRDGREMVVYVRSGGIWLTQEGDGADRFIGPGGSFRIASAGVTLISALGANGCVIHMERAATARVHPLLAPHSRPTTSPL